MPLFKTPSAKARPVAHPPRAALHPRGWQTEAWRPSGSPPGAGHWQDPPFLASGKRAWVGFKVEGVGCRVEGVGLLRASGIRLDGSKPSLLCRVPLKSRNKLDPRAYQHREQSNFRQQVHKDNIYNNSVWGVGFRVQRAVAGVLQSSSP